MSKGKWCKDCGSFFDPEIYNEHEEKCDSCVEEDERLRELEEEILPEEEDE